MCPRRTIPGRDRRCRSVGQAGIWVHANETPPPDEVQRQVPRPPDARIHWTEQPRGQRSPRRLRLVLSERALTILEALASQARAAVQLAPPACLPATRKRTRTDRFSAARSLPHKDSRERTARCRRTRCCPLLSEAETRRAGILLSPAAATSVSIALLFDFSSRGWTATAVLLVVPPGWSTWSAPWRRAGAGRDLRRRCRHCGAEARAESGRHCRVGPRRVHRADSEPGRIPKSRLGTVPQQTRTPARVTKTARELPAEGFGHAAKPRRRCAPALQRSRWT